MKRALLPFVLACLFSAAALTSNAQKDRFTYAITDLTPQGYNWAALRVIDLGSGEFSNVILNGIESNPVAYDANSKKEITISQRGQTQQTVFNTGVAGIALDAKNNRIWFTPMLVDELRYLDLKSMQVFHVSEAGLIDSDTKAIDQSNIITRMVIASDGFGYALSNDGKHFSRFTTGKNTTITNLGSLIDDPQNGDVSIHSSLTSYGGDIIADNEGNLWVFSAKNHVFKVNTESRVATFIGKINGLPTAFTTNGAAVTDENKILIVSATGTEKYLVESSNLTATLWETPLGFTTSDLGNSNILNTTAFTETAEELLENKAFAIQAFPNPVVNKTFSLQFGQLNAGEYTVQLTDILGRKVLQQVVVVGAQNQTQSIRIPNSTSQGFYIVSILDKTAKSVYSNRLLVE